jgi:DNA mismatch endonuclease (patch repair protein)
MIRPKASSPAALKRMQRQKRRDTKPEIALRKALYALGLRYRVDRQVLAGVKRRADIVFTGAGIAVFVDGCFWHSCPEHATTPRANQEWWQDKLRRNVERDRATDKALAEAGWAVVRIWEHEDIEEAASGIRSLVAERRQTALTSRHV